jgi:hypothetical protein
MVAPALLGSVEPSWPAFSLGTSADHLFSGTYSGVQMFDPTRPERLRRVGSAALPDRARRVMPHDGYAYVGDADGGLFILYTGDADRPDIVPPIRTPGPPTATPVPGVSVARVCPQLRSRVPPPVVDAALANPDRVDGWNQLQNLNAPPSPFNRRRVWLTLRSVAVPFNALFNPVLYRASCP